MNYKFLLDFEITKKKRILELHKASGEVYSHMIDLLFYMGYSKGKLVEDKEHWIYMIQDVAQFYFMETAYGFRVIETLLLAGNFTYASIILRTMLDSFAAYRFYMNRRDGVGYESFINKKSKRSWKDIYDNLSKDFYDNQYSTLSSSVHSNPITNHVFRLEGISNLKQNYATDNISIDFYSVLYNQIVHLFKGIYKLFFDIFPENIFNEEYYVELAKKLMNYINEDIFYRRIHYPKQVTMINDYENFIRDFKDLGLSEQY
jgi:hypothetical protein